MNAAYAEHNLGVVKAQRGLIPEALRLLDSAAQRYRNLDHIIAGDLSALRDDPSAHVSGLYGR